MTRVSPIAAIRALQMTQEELDQTTDLDIVRGFDHAVTASLRDT
jgi:hypothetical protein